MIAVSLLSRSVDQTNLLFLSKPQSSLASTTARYPADIACKWLESTLHKFGVLWVGPKEKMCNHEPLKALF